jgi:hypothetical protein
MDLNSKELYSGFEINNNNNLNDNKLKLLENKILIYQKENQSLKNKIKILQDDNDDKNVKIQEQLNHLLNLENDNNSLKKLYDNSKQKFNNEFINNKRMQDQEMNNMKLLIGELKSENEKLSKSLIIQSKENNKLQQNLMKTVSENKLYSKDNTILLSKVKEYEDNIFMLNNDKNDLNKFPNLNGKNKNEFINNINSMYENKLALYSSIINDEINIIAKYIDTYMNLNLFDDIKINIPPLQNITNFPKDNKLSSFWNIINAVENSLKRIISQNKIIKNNEMVLKQEINKLNNILEKKNNENLELKKNLSEMKKNLFYLKNDYDKINNDLSSQKGFNKQIQDTMNDINNGNDEYLKGLYKTIKSELDNIINEPLFHSYVNIMLEQKNNIKNDYNNGLKYLLGEILDKYILINNCIIDDFKKQKSQKGNKGFELNNFDKNNSNIQRLEVIIDELNKRIIQKDKIISSDKDEKKLLINQINILQKDIFNLKQNNKNMKKDDNILILDKNDYLQKDKTKMDNIKMNNNNINLDNNINNNNYDEQLIGNNKYIKNDGNKDNNNNLQNFNDNNNYINYNIQNENEIINVNNEEMKDNQTEDIEANEIYYEGNQLNNYNMNVVNYGNNNQYGQEMYDNINNEQNDMENENYNEEEEYKDEQEIQDYNNIYQFQDVIEEEDNENFTVEESNKTKSIKTGNFSINKSNLNNRDYINNELNFEEENNANIPSSQKEKMKNINLIEGNNLKNEQNNKELKSNKI